MQGGLATSPATDSLVMLASLYYEPLWIFYRDPATLSRINELAGRRTAVGFPEAAPGHLPTNCSKSTA